MCITGRASRRAAKVRWFKEQLFFLLVLWTGLPLPCGVLVWTKAEGDCRGPWTICITPRSPGGGRSWPREWKSAFIVWVKPWSEIHFYYTKSNDQSNEEGISQWTRRKVYTLMYPKTSYCYECFWWPLNRFTVSGYCVSSLREFPLQAMGPTVRDQGRFLFKRAKGISIAKLIPKKLFGPQLSAIFRNFLSPLCSSGRSLSRDIIDGRLWSSLSSTNHARTMLTKKLFFVSVDSSESSGESVSGFSSSSHSYHSAIGGEVEDVITVKESVIAQPTEASSILAGTTKKTQPPVPPKPKHKPKDHSKNLPCSKVQYGSE